jgi:hypothetical protein
MQQHIALLDHSRVVSAFTKLRDAASRHDVQVSVFYRYKLDEFIAKGCPVLVPDAVEVPEGMGILDAPEV